MTRKINMLKFYLDSTVARRVTTEIYRLDKQIRQSRIFTLQRKALSHQPISVAVLLIQGEAHIGGQLGEHAFHLQRRDAISFISVAQIQAHIVPKQDVAHFFMDFFSIGVYVTLLLEQFHDGEFEGVFVEVGHNHYFLKYHIKSFSIAMRQQLPLAKIGIKIINIQ